MHFKSIYKYMSFRDKIRISTLDEKYKNTLLRDIRPPMYFYDKVFDTQDITGLNTLFKFHKDIHTMETTYNLIKRSMKCLTILHLG